LFLQGTSKPVYYRCLWNENLFSRPTGMCSELNVDKLKLLTYHMSFLYGSASKAPRLPPVLKYGDKTGNAVMSYSKFIMDDRGFVAANEGTDDTSPSMYVDQNGDGRILVPYSPFVHDSDVVPNRMPFRHHLSA
jgi:Piwi domain